MRNNLIGKRVVVRLRQHQQAEWCDEFVGIVRGVHTACHNATFVLEVGPGGTGETSYMVSHRNIPAGGLVTITTNERVGVFVAADADSGAVAS